MRERVVTIGPTELGTAAWTRMRRIRHLVVSVEPETTLRGAADLMRTNLIGSLPVVDDGELAGIVTATDVFDALGDDARGALRKKPAGTRTRASQHEKREPFTDRVPRPTKRSAGRTSAPLVPVNIRVSGVALDDAARAYIRRRLGMKLGKFATDIERVTVRVEDVNGPRGGVDTSCRIKVVLSGLPSVTVETKGASLEDTINRALGGAERAVRRNVQRRRTKPLKAVMRKRAARTT